MMSLQVVAASGEDSFLVRTLSPKSEENVKVGNNKLLREVRKHS